MRSGTRLTLALILGLALAACGGTPTGSDPERRLSFEGSVTSAADGAPIQGATVKFVKHGRTRATTFADAAGRYALTVRTRCTGFTPYSFFSARSSGLEDAHLGAVAPGFASSFWGPMCTTATQTIDFVLTPWDP